MIIRLFNQVHQQLHLSGLFRIPVQTEIKPGGKRRLAAIRARFHKVPMIASSDIIGKAPVFIGIFSEPFRKDCHNAGKAVIVCCVCQRSAAHFCVFREAPVAQSVADNTILRHCMEKVHEFLHNIIIFRRRRKVSLYHVNIIRDYYCGALPCNTVIVPIPRSRSRHNGGQLPVFALCVTKIPEPFAVHICHIKIHERLLRGKMRVRRPAVLFTVRTVRRNRVKICQR